MKINKKNTTTTIAFLNYVYQTSGYVTVIHDAKVSETYYEV